MNRGKPFRLTLLLLPLAVCAACTRGGGGGAKDPFDLRGPAPEPDGSYAYDLTIVFTNDLHDQVLPENSTGRGGLARHATLIRWLREEAASRGKDVLVMNAGDCFEGTLFYEHDGGALIFRLLSLMGYDLVQIGNHDHQFGFQRLYDVVQSAFPVDGPAFTLLGGNLNPAGMHAAGSGPYGGPLPFLPAEVQPEVIAAFENSFDDFAAGTVDPALLDPPGAPSHLFQQVRIVDLDGIRVGVFGLDTAEPLYTAIAGEGELLADPAGRSQGCRFYDPVAGGFASAMIAYLEDPDGNPATPDHVHVIVALTHLGLAEDMQLAHLAASPSGRRIDVIVGGHSHTRLNTALPVAHASGAVTHIVQAGQKGEFLGRIDLAVDTVAGAVAVRNARLIQVDGRIPDDPAAAALIAETRSGPAGIDATYGNPFTRTVASSPRVLAGGSPAAGALGSLAVDAVRATANGHPYFLDVDAVVIGNFVFRADLPGGDITVADAHAILPLHLVDNQGTNLDVLDVLDLPGGVRSVLNFANFPFPAPNLQMTALEYFLEVVYSVDDLLAILSQALGLNIGEAGEYLAGLQWSGIEFEVDLEGPILQKIDPASILVGGIPLLQDPARSYRIGLNGIIARLALPFLQVLTQIEDPPGTGVFVPFPAYDPATAATPVVLWEALRDRLEDIGTLSLAQVRVSGDRPRSANPDLTLNGSDVSVQWTGAPGGSPVQIQGTVLNLGGTATLSALVEFLLDPTPFDATDDPDGWTDGLTGAQWVALGGIPAGVAPGHSAGIPGAAPFGGALPWPPGLGSGRFTVHCRIVQVVSADPGRPERVLANNRGGDLSFTVEVP